MSAAAKALPAEFVRLGLDRSTTHNISKVAMTLLGAPRANLEWIWESDRYRIRYSSAFR